VWDEMNVTNLFILLLALLASAPAIAATQYVATTGSDGASGTESDDKATVLL
jgi:hypothetical protein